MEIMFKIDLCWGLKQWAALPVDDALPEGEHEAAAELKRQAAASCVELRRHKQGMFDLVLCTEATGDRVRKLGMGLQTHVAKTRQPAKEAQGENRHFRAQK